MRYLPSDPPDADMTLVGSEEQFTRTAMWIGVVVASWPPHMQELWRLRLEQAQANVRRQTVTVTVESPTTPRLSGGFPELPSGL